MSVSNNNSEASIRRKKRVKPSKLITFDKKNWYIVTGFLGVAGFMVFQAVCFIIEVYAN